MQKKNNNQMSNLNKRIIAFSIVFVGFTQLRIGFIGIGELSILFLFVLALSKVKNIMNWKIPVGEFQFTKLWVLLFFIMSLGLGINKMFYAKYGDSDWVFDIFAYFYIIILCFTLEILFHNITEICELDDLLFKIFLFGGTVVAMLYVLASHRTSIFGFTLWYGGIRFSPFAVNPHQFAYFIAPLPFLGLRFLAKQQKKAKKLYILILIIFSILSGIATKSDTLKYAFVIGMISFILINYKNRIKYIPVFIITTLLIIFTIAISSNFITNSINYFKLNNNGRIDIWSSAIGIILRSPLVGHGPGSHTLLSNGYIMETHNAYLTILIQSGMIGFIYYSMFLVRRLKVIFNDVYLFSGIITLLVYGIGGTQLRRVSFWMFFIIYYKYSKLKDIERMKIKQ